MSTLPKVSVIIPAFNSEAYLVETIHSALSQTYTNMEIIVIDDGSTDQTQNLLRNFGERIQVVSQENGGVAAARNNGVRLSKGDFLAFLDSDDIWDSDKIRIQMSEISDAALSYTDRLNFGDLGFLAEVKSEANELREGTIFEPLLLEGNFITLSSTVIRRSVFEAVGGFDENREISGVEDWHLWLKIARHCKAKAIRKPLVKYRIHPDGISKNVKAMHHAQELVLDEFLADSTRQFANKARACSASTSAWFAANSGDFQLARSLYLKALRRRPLSTSTVKNLVKCFLHKA